MSGCVGTEGYSQYFSLLISAEGTRQCCECGEEIAAWEMHQLASGIDEGGEWQYHHTCKFCLEDWKNYQKINGMVVHGSLSEVIESAYFDAQKITTEGEEA